MGSFHRTNLTEEGFIRGAARLLIADPAKQAFPTKLGDIIELGASQAEIVSVNLGPAVTGGTFTITVTRGSNSQTTSNIAYNAANTAVDTAVEALSNVGVGNVAVTGGPGPNTPYILTFGGTLATTNWEMSVGSALAEVTLEKIDYVWEGGAITSSVESTGTEKHLTLGQPTSYTQRRLAVLFQRPNQKIRAYIFRKTQRTPQESAFTHQKTGEQATLPIRWKCLADDTVSDVNARFGEIIDQV
jgi:hypothetical protein